MFIEAWKERFSCLYLEFSLDTIDGKMLNLNMWSIIVNNKFSFSKEGVKKPNRWQRYFDYQRRWNLLIKIVGIGLCWIGASTEIEVTSKKSEAMVEFTERLGQHDFIFLSLYIREVELTWQTETKFNYARFDLKAIPAVSSCKNIPLCRFTHES